MFLTTYIAPKVMIDLAIASHVISKSQILREYIALPSLPHIERSMLAGDKLAPYGYLNKRRLMMTMSQT